MPPLSALSAALAGKPEAPSQGESGTASAVISTTARWEALHRDVAFPCLRLARPDGVQIQEVSTGYEKVDIASASFAGTSLAHGSVKGSLVDYELNPFKRRGGKEVLTSSLRGFASERRRESLDANLITEAVYGSLRAGLSDIERSSIRQNSLMSPSLSAINELGLDRANTRTEDAKRMRRHVLRGAVVVFITAGYSGKKFIFERCKELGVRTVIVDGPESWSQELVAEGMVEKFVGVDFSDAETLFDRIISALKQVRADIGIDGVTTFCELAVPLVSRVAEALGLPGNTPLAVDTARNKHSARRCMEEAGLPTPRNVLITTGAADLEAAARHVGFPAVIKPISGAASIGVVRVNDLEMLKESYQRVVNDLKNSRVVAGALVQGDGGDEDGPGNASSWVDLSVMMEEYLDGPEVDVDLVFSESAPVYGCITDNWPTVEPYFNETGSNCPSILPWDQQVQLLDLGIKAVECMGFEMGVFHVELKFTSRGPRLIEVNARMGGGPVRDTNLLVWGVDLVEEHLLGSCGIPCKPSVAQTPLQELAEYSLNAKVTGILERDDFMDDYVGMEGVLYARPLVAPGAKCVSVDKGMPTWMAEIMVSMRPVQKAIDFIVKMEEEISAKMPIRPVAA